MKPTLFPLLALLALPSAPSLAVPILLISDGLTTITVADGGVGDANPAAGAVSWIGSIGVWDNNSVTGITKPALGYSDLPIMNLSFLSTSSGAGTLTLMFTETDYAHSTASWASIRFGGTTTGTAKYDLYGVAAGPTRNDPFDTTRSLGSIGPLSGAFSASGGNQYLWGTRDPYSLTQVVTIAHSGPGVSSGSAYARIPDTGASSVMLGLVMVGIAGLRRVIGRRS